MHLSLYMARPDAAAIVHAHPGRLLALSLGVTEQDFLRLPLFEAENLRAGLAFAPALPPGTEDLARATAHAAARPEIRAIWMQGHGLTCLGGNLTQAVALAEELEHLAAVQLFQKSMNSAHM
jgi:L-fuculose-phosphate aldolase